MTIETARPQVIYADLGAPAAVIVQDERGPLVVADHHVSPSHLAAAVTTAAVLDGPYKLDGPAPLPLPHRSKEPDGG